MAMHTGEDLFKIGLIPIKHYQTRIDPRVLQPVSQSESLVRRDSPVQTSSTISAGETRLGVFVSHDTPPTPSIPDRKQLSCSPNRSVSCVHPRRAVRTVAAALICSPAAPGRVPAGLSRSLLTAPTDHQQRHFITVFLVVSSSGSGRGSRSTAIWQLAWLVCGLYL